MASRFFAARSVSEGDKNRCSQGRETLDENGEQDDPSSHELGYDQ